jgi:hypothetical protein
MRRYILNTLAMVGQGVNNMPLSVSQGAGAWIDDFVNSTDTRFKGKSKAKRRQQALAAYYAKKRRESLVNPLSPVSLVLRELIGSSGTALSTNPTTDLGNISNKPTTRTNVTSSESPTGLRQPSLSGQVQTGDVGPNNLNRPSISPSLDQSSLDVNPGLSSVPSPAPLVAPSSTIGAPSALTTGANSLLGTTDTEPSKSPRELSNALAKNSGSQL